MIRTENLVFEYAAYGEEPAGRDVLDIENPHLAALRDVDISIEKGEFVCILGHNGSGKSTLAKHLNALLLPTKGTVWVNGYNTSDENNTWPVRQSAGMVFQNPDNQIIATIVEEDVAFGPENLGIAPPEIRKRVDEAIAAVGMAEYLDAAPHFLSGGQKQRVAIAGILAMEPDCIVLDEPTAMLDPVGRKEVLETVTRLNREKNITVILITHYMDEAVKANRVIVMEDGRICMDGDPHEIFSRVPEMKALGLDVPQVTEVAYRLKNRGVPIRGDVVTIPEMIAEIMALKDGGGALPSLPAE